MEATELRINNYVFQQNGKDGKKDLVYQIENVNRQSALKYEPIPLTEDWLLKLGFETLYDSHVVFMYKLGSFYCDNKFQPTDNGQISKYYDLKSVHQLQNFYFALTGEELTIKN